MPSGTTITDLLERLQGEYLERPGLRLTGAKARELWNLDRFGRRTRDGRSDKGKRPSKTRH
jgi:hypothetical protein